MRNSSPICVDANLIVRLVASPENEMVQSLWREWREQRRRLVAPHLIRYEVTNAIHRLVLDNPAERRGLRRGIDAMLALPIELHDDHWLHEGALDFAERFHLKAAYDAYYLALADRLACPFWTADRRLYNAVSSSLSWVQLLGS